ncbi:hypothetical protein [Aliivibrio fischeri]|uniref:hypothetical protein n=1 Tax=Aliivibrio fischeri TaxID=668 RepID=UPI0007C47F3A|nr:hypothetical protein [Aliivibrio fischeri]
MAFVVCSRCGGDGKVVHMHVMNGICFKCKGTGKTRKMKRVRVIDTWFSVEHDGNKHHTKTIEEAESLVSELRQIYGNEEIRIIPKSSYHYEQFPA